MLNQGWILFPQGNASIGKLACPRLPKNVVFAASERAARATLLDPAWLTPIVSNGDAGALLWVAETGRLVASLSFDEAGRTTRDAEFPFAGFPLRIGAGAVVQSAAQDGWYTVVGGSGQITYGETAVSQVEVRGGTMHFGATILWAGSAASLRYFYGQAGALGGFEYPVFAATSEQSIDVSVKFAPLRPGEPSENALTLLSAAKIPSNFLTVGGTPVSLAIIPNQSQLTQQWDPLQQTLYQAPAGNWQLEGASHGASGPTGNLDLMCGLSGLEYARVANGSVLQFVPGAPAYAKGFPGSGITGATQVLYADCPGSTLPVTTSWAYFASKVSATGVGTTGQTGPQGYYSQPQHGGLFTSGPSGASAPILDAVPLQTARFPTGAVPSFGPTAPSFPMVPYGAVSAQQAADSALYQQFEIGVLGTARNNAIFDLNFGATAGPAPTGPTGHVGTVAVTPQGLRSTFSPDFSVWRQCTLVSTQNGTVNLEIRWLHEGLRAALLTSQLFLVVSDVATFRQYCDLFFQDIGIADWSFGLTPENWRDDTVMIIKSSVKPLEELIANTSLWSAPTIPFNQGAQTQAILQQCILDARQHADLPEFSYFLNTVLGDWNGVLFFNCQVPPGSFPPQLRALAAGIDAAQFKAHHFGVNFSPVQVSGGQIEVSDSVLFGLIFYDEATDLVYAGKPYAFKVLSLRVLFANSDISSFSSQIELLVGELFGELCTLQDSQHGNNLILNGVMQRHDGTESYSFSEEGTNLFVMDSQVLAQVYITKAQFITLPQAPGSTLVSSRFLLWGMLQFRELKELDLFSFGPASKQNSPPPRVGRLGRRLANGPAGAGGLQFSNLAVSMAYRSGTGPSGPSGPSGQSGPTGPTEVDFAFEAGQATFDLASSAARPQSLYSRFPLEVSAMLQGDAVTTPASLGFIQVDSPLTPGSIDGVWFGLAMTLSLGSQGSLAAKAGFNATLLAAWAPSAQSYNTLVAIQLPGSQGGSKSLTIEGPLKLSIGDIALLLGQNQDQSEYLLRFANIALSFLSLKFPPGGQTNVLLFGDPDPNASNTTLGWYAAYKKDAAKKGPTGPSQSTFGAQPANRIKPRPADAPARLLPRK